MRFTDFKRVRHQSSIDATLDHIIKREDGGTLHMSNVRLAHGACNAGRHHKTEDYLRRDVATRICGWLGEGDKKRWCYVVAMRRHTDWDRAANRIANQAKPSRSEAHQPSSPPQKGMR
jgi:hypothetical protein